MNKTTILFTFAFSLFTFVFSFAQESKIVKTDTLKTANTNQPNSPQAEEGDVKITDGTNTLIRITDEGTFGAIEIKNGVPSATTDKLYNDAGTLKFDGSSLGGGSGADSINQLADAKYDGESLFLGVGAGTNDDGANYNTAVGKNTLFTNTTGYDNTAIGLNALYSNLGGSSNTATGVLALNANTGGSRNTANGLRSLYQNTSGYENVAEGAYASYYNSTGFHNTVSGYQALYYNSTGSKNTIIGYKAGYGAWNQSQSGNIFLGYNAGYSETGSNKLYIENSNSATPLIYGDFTMDSIKINGELEVTSKTKTLSLQVTTGAADGYVLTSDATGNATWQASSSGGVADSINQLADAIYDGSSLFLGVDAGINDDGTANNNTAVGKNALKTNSYGTQNTAVGTDALPDNTNGGSNTALRYHTLWQNTGGDDNTAVGAGSLLKNGLGNGNTAVGRNALYGNSSGESNVGIGFGANYYNTGGSQNTIIGYYAGGQASANTKSGNVFLGYYAGYYEISDDKLYIENSSSSSPLIWGDFANDFAAIHGKLGISTKAPTSKIDIEGSNGYDQLRMRTSYTYKFCRY